MGSERPTLSILIILCVLTGVQGFCMADIHPDLENVVFSVQVSYDGAVVDTHEYSLSNKNIYSFVSTNWTGYITFKASFVGANQIVIETTIGGIGEENSAWFTWNGSGYAGSFTTSNGYTIETAESGYFDGGTIDPEPIDEEVTTVGILIAFGIGVLLWQVYASSMRERSVTW